MTGLEFGQPLSNVGRCPQCNIAKPLLNRVWGEQLSAVPETGSAQYWAVYQCSSCNRFILAEGFVAPLVQRSITPYHRKIVRLYPAPKYVDESLPDEARRYLQQAIDTIAAPDASLVMSAAAIDAMLKTHKYSKGSLYERIDKAVADHLLTEGMGRWAHSVRLNANAVRHADDQTPPPSRLDAERALEFATALGDFLLVFTTRVDQGMRRATEV